MKKVLALVLVVTFSFTYGVAPVFAGGGPQPAGKKGGFGSFVREGPRAGQDKNPTLAAIMSGLIPCTGQWYNGELLTWKSAAMAALEAGGIFVLVFFLAWGDNTGERMISMAGGGVMIANHVWSAWDAHHSAKRINQGFALQLDENRAMVSYNVPF